MLPESVHLAPTDPGALGLAGDLTVSRIWPQGAGLFAVHSPADRETTLGLRCAPC